MSDKHAESEGEKSYTPSPRLKRLISCYETAYSATEGNGTVEGEGNRLPRLDPAAHARGIMAVSAMVKAEAALESLEGEDGYIEDLQRVADASSVLLLFVDAATRQRTRLRDEAAVISTRVHALLRAAGYVNRNPQTGHRERPASSFSVKDLIP